MLRYTFTYLHEPIVIPLGGIAALLRTPGMDKQGVVCKIIKIEVGKASVIGRKQYKQLGMMCEAKEGSVHTL